jgi:hypothetical protein
VTEKQNLTEARISVPAVFLEGWILIPSLSRGC